MRPIDITKLTWYLTRNLTPWEIHERKQLLRKAVHAFIVFLYIAGGIFIFLNETGRLNFKSSIGEMVNGQVVKVGSNELILIAERDSLLKEKMGSRTAVNLNTQVRTSMLDDRLQKTNVTDTMMPIIHMGKLVLKADSLSESLETCSKLIVKPTTKKHSDSQVYWHSPLIDFDYADRVRKNYSGCVLEHLEQPYASIALAISAIYAYQDNGQKGFNFLGEKVWGKKEFKNASEYFEEFSRVYNPSEIENEYFDKYQDKKLPLVEQYWRAYIEKYFPEVHPKTIREVMRRWGYEYTEF